MNTAVIVGSSGQDGTLLYDFLDRKGYQIVGIGRDTIISNFDSGLTKPINILHKKDVFDLLFTTRPSEIYYLAAFHHSSEDEPIDEHELYLRSYQINVLGLLNFLEGARKVARQAKIFYASSSLIFGRTQEIIQDENTPFNPACVYGITKLNGLLCCRYYRAKYDLFASSGILYNHESHLRKDKFLSKKVIKAAINISKGLQDNLVIGDLQAEVDWGYAPDYVEAMYLILNHSKPDDFIIASGTKHSVREFVTVAFDLLDIDWKKYVTENKSIVRRKRNAMIGNPAKLYKATNWVPKHTFEEMIRQMLIDESDNL